MEWQIMLSAMLGGLFLLFLAGMPVAFAFIIINVVMGYIFWGGGVGLEQLLISVESSVRSFILVPIPLFILMGEVIYQSQISPYMIDALDKWLGRLPGRLGLLAVGGGTLFSTLTGASVASVAMLSAALTPEMERRGYKKSMSLGPILGSGGLAIMIPPSSLAVFLGAVGEISVGKLLMGIIGPGLLMAVLYAAYIVIRCQLQPSIAPAYQIPPTPLLEKVIATVKYILPIGFIIFMVVGVIFLGIATPSEAAATGALGCFILAAAYRRMSWEVAKKALTGTLNISVMIFILIVGAKVFSQNIAYVGASQGLAAFIVGLQIQPFLIIVAMMLAILVLGMFISPGTIIVIMIPLFMPVIKALGYDPIWYAALFMLNVEMAQTSPPFGMTLFVMKQVAPPDTTLGDCYRAALPFLFCDAVAMAFMVVFPIIALWLPSVMY